VSLFKPGLCELVWSELETLASCTRLTATATAAWPAMTAWIALGPKVEATTNTADWKYETSAAVEAETIIMNTKNVCGLVRTRVEKNVKTVMARRARIDNRTWRVGDEKLEVAVAWAREMNADVLCAMNR